MALSHALLVTLLDKPQTGYELGKRFDRTVGFFWRASHQQIYSELHRMADKGHISSNKVAQADRPNRIVYTITEAGREAIQHWAALDSPAPSVKEELLVKLFALGTVEKPVITRLLENRLAQHRERLADYRRVMAEHYPQAEKLSDRQRGRYLGLRLGIRTEETGIDWCEEALQTLSK